MSLRTRIKGFTAWVNLRLKPYDHLLNNIVMDILTGTNMKMLLESMTGREFKRLHTMDGLTQQQKITRIEWFLEELKRCKVIPDDVRVDTRMFAMRSADHIFQLLWRLVSHDIWFTWERAEYLQQNDDEVLCEVPFKWIPEPPPAKKKKTKAKKSLLSGFGASSFIEEDLESESPEAVETYDPFPRAEYVKRFKARQRPPGEYPAPDECVLELVNRHLRMVHEGKKLHCLSVDDLVDSRVLCALVNSFLPNTFTTEVLLNDRWTINMVLRTMEKLMFINSPFDSEDLVEADPMSVCAYFCVFFMVAYKFRQCRAVVRRLDFLHRMIRECSLELEKSPSIVSNMAELQRRKELKTDIENIKKTIEYIERKFDVPFCRQWIEHIVETQKQTHKEIKQKIRGRFDTLRVPRNITINDLCLSLVINLSLTNGSGFYLLDSKEMLSEGRRIVLRDRETGDFIDDFTSKNKTPIRKILRLKQCETVEVSPDHYPKYDIFIEASSRNKHLKAGTTFLYEVFPGNTLTWQKLFLKATRENEFETVQKLVVFFRTHPSFINCHEPQTGNTPLHIAAKLGHYDISLYLLENGANIDSRNAYKQTPLFAACEGLQRHIAHLLVEWGCDVHFKGPRGQTAFETIKNDEFRDFLINAYEHYSSTVPKVMAGNTELLAEMVRHHTLGIRELNNLRSRCINGSTLIHTASYFGVIPVLKELLTLSLDVNLLDYKGATPLHRAKDNETIKVLMEAGAKPSCEDLEGNTPLHVKCYGESGKASEMEAIDLLITSGAKLTARNNRGLMPIHCAAMQGRVDVINLLVMADTEGEIKQAIAAEKNKSPPSVVHLAVANDFTECADWLLSQGYEFKEGEQDTLLRRILTEQIKLSNRVEAVKFLLDFGADANPAYPGGNSALHYAASMSGPTDVLELLIGYGADMDAPNDDMATALFFACQCNNHTAAAVLIGQGANVRCKNLQGLTALDFIMDFDEWIECGYFNDEIRARLKAYSLKHTRDLIRAISKKVKTNRSMFFSQFSPQETSLYNSLPHTAASSASLTRTQSQGALTVYTPDNRSAAFTLPPLQRKQGFLMY